METSIYELINEAHNLGMKICWHDSSTEGAMGVYNDDIIGIDIIWEDNQIYNTLKDSIKKYRKTLLTNKNGYKYKSYYRQLLVSIIL